MSTMSCGFAFSNSSAYRTLILRSSFKNSVNTMAVLLEPKPRPELTGGSAGMNSVEAYKI